MLICERCRSKMKCEKNGVGAYWGHKHAYACDRYVCPSCKATVLLSTDNSMYDPDHKLLPEYIDMLPEDEKNGDHGS